MKLKRPFRRGGQRWPSGVCRPPMRCIRQGFTPATPGVGSGGRGPGRGRPAGSLSRSAGEARGVAGCIPSCRGGLRLAHKPLSVGTQTAVGWCTNRCRLVHKPLSVGTQTAVGWCTNRCRLVASDPFQHLPSACLNMEHITGPTPSSHQPARLLVCVGPPAWPSHTRPPAAYVQVKVCHSLLAEFAERRAPGGPHFAGEPSEHLHLLISQYFLEQHTPDTFQRLRNAAPRPPPAGRGDSAARDGAREPSTAPAFGSHRGGPASDVVQGGGGGERASARAVPGSVEDCRSAAPGPLGAAVPSAEAQRPGRVEASAALANGAQCASAAEAAPPPCTAGSVTDSALPGGAAPEHATGPANHPGKDVAGAERLRTPEAPAPVDTAPDDDGESSSDCENALFHSDASDDETEPTLQKRSGADPDPSAGPAIDATFAPPPDPPLGSASALTASATHHVDPLPTCAPASASPSRLTSDPPSGPVRTSTPADPNSIANSDHNPMPAPSPGSDPDPPPADSTDTRAWARTVLEAGVHRHYLSAARPMFRPDSAVQDLLTDLRALLQREGHCFDSPRQVARVLHGLHSPKFPVESWGDHRLWGRYSDVEFDALLRVCTANLNGWRSAFPDRMQAENW